MSEALFRGPFLRLLPLVIPEPKLKYRCNQIIYRGIVISQNDRVVPLKESVYDLFRHHGIQKLEMKVMIYADAIFM